MTSATVSRDPCEEMPVPQPPPQHKKNFITLPRSALYELIWSKPVRDVASEFGISDVALAKRCRALKIPVPPRAHWAKVAAGHRSRRPPLPPFTVLARGPKPSYVSARATNEKTDPSTEPVVTFDPQRPNHTITVPDAELPTVAVHHDVTDLSVTLPIVKRTAKHHKHARRAELELKRGEATGPILRLDVSPDTLDRALLFANSFLHAAAELGWTPVPPPEPTPPDPRHYYGRPPEPKPNPGPHYADLSVDHGKRVVFSISERFELKPLPPTAADLAKQKKYPYLRLEKRHETVWSGVLRLKRERLSYPYQIDAHSWRESAHQSLTAQLPKILGDFRAVAARMKDVDDEHDREERAREEAARLAKERAARRATNAKLIHELERQAGAWSRALTLRRYLRAARRALGDAPSLVKVDGREVDFLRWAEHYVEQLDPLHPTPRDPDLGYERSFYFGADDKRANEEQLRLSGHAWEGARKLLTPSTTNDGAEDDD